MERCSANGQAAMRYDMGAQAAFDLSSATRSAQKAANGGAKWLALALGRRLGHGSDHGSRVLTRETAQV